MYGYQPAFVAVSSTESGFALILSWCVSGRTCAHARAHAHTHKFKRQGKSEIADLIIPALQPVPI